MSVNESHDVNSGEECEIMGAINGNSTKEFIIADVTRDGAYATIPLSEAASLPEWR